MNKTITTTSILISIAALVLTASGCGRISVVPGSNQSPRIDWAVPPSIDAGQFDYADAPREFNFPGDHGAHLNFQTEWWYFTGNLKSNSGDDYGYQLTFFRRALLPEGENQQRTSYLAANQVYMAHFTITDGRKKAFHPSERFSRGGGNLAGAVSDPLLSVWLEDWRVQQLKDDHFRLFADTNDLQLDLELFDEGGVFLQGEKGLSKKSEDTASYYYSMPNLRTLGSLTISNEIIPVTGLSWLDHEFSTSTLAPDQIGWDWFALHLDNGTDIMAYTMRRVDGSFDPYSHGSIMEKGQPVNQLGKNDYEIISVNTWTSPISGAQYPSGWKLSIPSRAIELTISPLIQNQELNFAFTYWEGAVKIVGIVNGESVNGYGYVELTGYAESMQGKF